jgi:hypothetical protein
MLDFTAMKLPPVDLSFLQERIAELATQVREAWEGSGDTGDSESPVLLRDAMRQLLELLGRIDPQTDATAENAAELTTLGEYGMHLLEQLSEVATRCGQADLAREIEHLSLPFALWLARRGAEIRRLAPVVNALAHHANQVSQPQSMVGLYTCFCEVVEALSPNCEEPGNNDPHHPWRLLLLNRAIVATRSHNPELMVPAFDAIVEQLPADAENFFAEGMEQIMVIDYPEQVKAVIRRYFLAHARPKKLH